MYDFSDFNVNFTFVYDDKSYTETDFPTNNGSFHAVDKSGNSSIFNIADVIENSKYTNSGRNAAGEKICRICGTPITNGVNGCTLSDKCTECSPPPRYITSCKVHYINEYEEIDILEALATSMNDDEF